ncbi:hypothetical protein HPB51_007091 [Rhipicephalus microplus]|uniref:Lipase domain-containing protein n=1 Tax=Rhipicephalus microplus TaxID=6941 RepID=A0A9J6DZW9_RHIMP|nr:hypothetical protein HPB51_007091 [Rhipicephalus microplus]
MVTADAVVVGSGNFDHLGLFKVHPKLRTRAYNISAFIGNAAVAAEIRSRDLQLQPTSKSRSNPELSTSSPSGDAARYLDSSAKVFDSVVPGKFAEKLLPKFDGKKDKVCYKFVGCFSNRDRFTHPTSFPSDPEQVDTKFMLYSRSNRRSPVKLDYRPTKSIGNLAQFNQRKPLKLIVHGFLESGNVSWIQGIKDAFLDEEDCNVIIIDWSGGAQLLSYIKASGNTALVGRETSLLVQRLIGTYRNTLSKDQVHIVGFSLGGQIAGFFGRHFKNSTGQLISRITGISFHFCVKPVNESLQGLSRSLV